MKKRKNQKQRMRSVPILITLIMLLGIIQVSAIPESDGLIKTVYVAGTNGNDDNDGASKDTAVSTIKKAYELVTADGDGTIVICDTIYVEEELLPAKAVTITSKTDTEDFTNTAVWFLNSSKDTYFQADTHLENITLSTSSEGYGFVANGYEFHVGKGVTVNTKYNRAHFYIIGGRSIYHTNATAAYRDGANIIVESGANWVIYGAGAAVFGNENEVLVNTEPISITVSGDAQVNSIIAGFKTSTQPDPGKDSEVCKFGDVTINVTENAQVKETYLGSECYQSGCSEQTENGVITLNMNKDSIFSSVYAGGQYAYHVGTANRSGQEQKLSNIVINYYGAIINNAIYLGGADAVYHPDDEFGSPLESIGNVTLNLYEDCEAIVPGIRADIGAGLDDDGKLITNRARINVIDNRIYEYTALEGYSNIIPCPPTTRIVRYTDSGSIEAPQKVQDDYIPHIIEFATNKEVKDTDTMFTNVMQFENDFALNGISIDETSSNIRLKGDTVPVITATDFVNNFCDTVNDSLENTFINNTHGLISLSFINSSGELWKPEVGTVVFQVPEVNYTGMNKKDILDMFTMLDMEGYGLAYQEGTYENKPIGQLIIVGKKYTVEFDTNGIGAAPDSILTDYNTIINAPKAPVSDDYIFDDWYKDSQCTQKWNFELDTITEDTTLYAGWKCLKYTLHYGDGRENDGIWGYNYDEGENGYYKPSETKLLPSENRFFSEEDISSGKYAGTTVQGYYLLGWRRYVEVLKENINDAYTVYIKENNNYIECSNWESINDTLYQFLPEAKTPSTNSGNVDYFAQWLLIEIDIDIDVDVNVDISVANGTDSLININDNQKIELAKNIDLENDIRGNNCEINVTAYVKDAINQDELSEVNTLINNEFGTIKHRLDYDVSILKNIKVNGIDTNDSPILLKELASPIEVTFAIPEQWQTNGKVFMYRTHTSVNGQTILAEKLVDQDNDPTVYTVKTDEFSTYTMIYLPEAPIPQINTGDLVSQYTLSYVSNGGTVYSKESYLNGSLVSIEKKPFKQGYIFKGWYIDEALTQPVTSILINTNKTVYAGWEQSKVPDMLNGEDHFAYIIGYSDGTVQPNGSITRAEVATIFFRLLKDDIREKYLSELNTFNDINQSDWYNISISTMQALKIINGRTENLFDPTAAITRGEFAAICARFNSTENSDNNMFSDINEHWAKEHIQQAASFGWIQGYEDETFRPDNLITRAEAIAMINRVLQRLPQSKNELLDNMLIWEDNIDDNMWYYIPVQEATNSHEYMDNLSGSTAWTSLTDNKDWTIYQ